MGCGCGLLLLRGLLGWQLVLLLLDFDLHQGVGVVLVEVCRAHGHLLFLQNSLHLLVADLLVLNEEVTMLGLSVTTVHFLL